MRFVSRHFRPVGADGWPIYAAGLAMTLIVTLMMIMGQGTLLTALLVAALLGVILVRSRIAAIYTTLAYVTLLGDLRRIRDMAFPHPPLDLFLLVTPIIAIILAAPVLLRLKAGDKLAIAMFSLLALMSLEIFNPLQGGIGVGLTGAMFNIVPILWFWIGREYGSVEVARTFMYKVFLPLSIIAAVLGICQGFIGFLPWEQAWIDANRQTFVILNLGGGNSRPFGYFVSPAEYATFIAMAAAAAGATWFTSKRAWTLAFPLLAIATFLAGSRGAIIKLLFALVLLVAIRKTKHLGFATLIRLIALLVVGFGAVAFTASRFDSGTSSDAGKVSTSQAAIAHQTAGLANPLDERKSTAGIHSQMFLAGIISGFKTPIGLGIGFETGGAAKLGVATSSDQGPVGSSEIDISDMFIATGFIGGFLYIYVIGLVLRECLVYIREVPADISYPIAVVIVSGITSWLQGGQYSTSAVMLFFIGCVAHPLRKRSQRKEPRRRRVPAIAVRGLPSSI